MWKYLAGAFLQILGVVGAEASGHDMTKFEGPRFAVGTDNVLSGTEPEFAACKSFQAKYLSGIAAKTNAISYAYSSEWGYVLRVLYVNVDALHENAERGTLVCWRQKGDDAVKFLVDVPGTAADLIPNRNG